MPDYGHKKLLTIEIWQWIGVLLMFLLAWILFLIAKKAAFFVLKKLQHQITKNTNLEINKVLKKLAHPLSLLVVFAFFDKVICIASIWIGN